MLLDGWCCELTSQLSWGGFPEEGRANQCAAMAHYLICEVIGGPYPGSRAVAIVLLTREAGQRTGRASSQLHFKSN